MFKPVSRAGTYVITPPLRTEDASPDVADANADALRAAAESAGRYNGTVQLPGGHIYLGGTGGRAFTFDERHAGIVLRGGGPGKTVLVATTPGMTLGLVSRLVDGRSQGTIVSSDTVEVPNLDQYVVGEVIYFWTIQQGPNRSPRSRGVIDLLSTNPDRVRVDGGSSTGFSDFKHVKGFAVNPTVGSGQPIPAGSTAVRVADLQNVAPFAVGDDVLLGDGPGINEFFGEWLTVAAVNTSTGDITFTTPTVQEYAADLASLVPGYQPFPPNGPRQHMSDIVVRDLAIAAPPPGQSTAADFGLVRAGLRLAFENVAFLPQPGAALPTAAPEFGLATCGRLSVRNTTLGGSLLAGACQNAAFDGVTASEVRCHEYARDCVFTACRTDGPGGFTLGAGPSSHVDLTNCTFSGYGSTEGVANVAFAADSAITGVTLRPPALPDPPDPVVVTAQRLRLTALASGSPVKFALGSSAVLLSPLESGQVGDESGQLDQPLTVRRDGVVRVPTFVLATAYGPDLMVVAADPAGVGLRVRGQASQAADLQQWQTRTTRRCSQCGPTGF